MNPTAPSQNPQLAALNCRYLQLRSEIERERAMMNYPAYRRLSVECTAVRNEIVSLQSNLKTARRRGVKH